MDGNSHFVRSLRPSPGLEVSNKLLRKIPFSILLKRNLLRFRLAVSRKKDVFDVYKEREAIFIRIPKNGSTSLCLLLFGESPQNPWPAHWAADYYRVVAPRLFSKAQVFAPVRDPAARLRSAFKYYKYGSSILEERKIIEGIIGAEGRFEDFLLYLCKAQDIEAEPIMQWHHFRRQVDFISDQSGRLIVNFIFPIEDMVEAIAEISKWFPIKRDVPIENSSSGPACDIPIPLKVSEFYSADQELWNKAMKEKVYYVR